MQKQHDQQEDAGRPQQRRRSVQQSRVVIDLVWSEEDLKIAEQVRDHVSEKDKSADGHDHLLADGGIVEARGPAIGDADSGSAHVPLSRRCDDDNTAHGGARRASRAGNEIGFPLPAYVRAVRGSNDQNGRGG